jgi:multicomponent Na+:H+ antiporter subunit G
MDLLIALVALSGAFFMFMAGVGLLRMPDLFLRMSAMAKAGTLGAGLMLLATILFFNDFIITSRALAAIVFIFLTAPVAAHMIARAAYFDGTPLWDGTTLDELRGHYHTRSHVLDSTVHPADDTVIIPMDDEDLPPAR